MDSAEIESWRKRENINEIAAITYGYLPLSSTPYRGNVGLIMLESGLDSNSCEIYYCCPRAIAIGNGVVIKAVVALTFIEASIKSKNLLLWPRRQCRQREELQEKPAHHISIGAERQ